MFVVHLVGFQDPYHEANGRIPFDVFPEPNFPPGQFLHGRTHKESFVRIRSEEIGHGSKVQIFKIIWSLGCRERCFEKSTAM